MSTTAATKTLTLFALCALVAGCNRVNDAHVLQIAATRVPAELYITVNGKWSTPEERHSFGPGYDLTKLRLEPMELGGKAQVAVSYAVINVGQQKIGPKLKAVFLDADGNPLGSGMAVDFWYASLLPGDAESDTLYIPVTDASKVAVVALIDETPLPE